jgi:hypothetical protein
MYKTASMCLLFRIYLELGLIQSHLLAVFSFYDSYTDLVYKNNFPHKSNAAWSVSYL